MTDLPVWRVVVTGNLSDQELERLSRSGAQYVSGHSGPGLVSSSFFVTAANDRAATVAVTQSLSANAVIREVQQMPFFVYATIEPEEVTAFRNASDDDSQIGAVVEAGADGEPEVYFSLLTNDSGQAVQEAERLFDHVIREHGIERQTEPQFTVRGYGGLLQEPVESRAQLRRAQSLADDGYFESALVAAQTACEILVRDAFPSLLASAAIDSDLAIWILSRLRMSLRDSSSRDLWNQLSGVAIQQQDFWPDYVESAKDRNRVVHEGASVGQSRAERGISAAERFVRFIEEAVVSRERPEGAAAEPDPPD